MDGGEGGADRVGRGHIRVEHDDLGNRLEPRVEVPVDRLGHEPNTALCDHGGELGRLSDRGRGRGLPVLDDRESELLVDAERRSLAVEAVRRAIAVRPHRLVKGIEVPTSCLLELAAGDVLSQRCLRDLRRPATRDGLHQHHRLARSAAGTHRGVEDRQQYPLHGAVWPAPLSAVSFHAMADRTEWARRVAQWRASGETAVEFCSGRDFAASTLRWYSSQLGAVAPQPEPQTAMIEVRREPARAGHVLVELGGARVHVPRGVDVETLSTVFDALRGAEDL